MSISGQETRLAALSLVALALAGCASSTPIVECERRKIALTPWHSEMLDVCIEFDLRGCSRTHIKWPASARKLITEWRCP